MTYKVICPDCKNPNTHFLQNKSIDSEYIDSPETINYEDLLERLNCSIREACETLSTHKTAMQYFDSLSTKDKIDYLYSKMLEE